MRKSIILLWDWRQKENNNVIMFKRNVEKCLLSIITILFFSFARALWLSELKISIKAEKLHPTDNSIIQILLGLKPDPVRGFFLSSPHFVNKFLSFYLLLAFLQKSFLFFPGTLLLTGIQCRVLRNWTKNKKSGYTQKTSFPLDKFLLMSVEISTK